MRRLFLLAGALVLPVLSAAPASAVTPNVICVGPGLPGCDQTAASISAAILAAGSNALDDVILVATGTYSDGPYELDGSLGHALTLKGSGAGTVLTLPSSAMQESYVFADTATVQDLTITMATTNSSNDTGLALSHATVDHVTVNGAVDSDSIHAGNSTITSSSALSPFGQSDGSRGIYSSGGNTMSDMTITGTTAFDLSDPGATDAVSRVSVRTDYQGFVTDGGTIGVDDALIDLGTADSTTGLAAANFNNSASLKTINADHVTIVGGGAGSRGAWAYAAASGAKQTSTVNLTNSIVRGPATSLVADADNDGSQAGNSTATLNASYSDWQSTGGTIGAHGAGGVLIGAGHLNVDPAFVSASNFHLTPASPVVDQGDPAAGGPTLDLDRQPRVADGDGNGTSVTDMGAYELDTTPPDTSLLTGPPGASTSRSASFTFSSEAGATFECRLDAATFTACTSPSTVTGVADGTHTFAVRAKDASANVDPSPAMRTFTVDTLGPTVSITDKPARKTTKKKVTIAFTAEAGATFQCMLDKGPWKACTSPWKIRLKVGKHLAYVRAVDPLGNIGPASKAVKVRRVKKHH